MAELSSALLERFSGVRTKPEVSVVMSVYNGARTLRATLASVLAQEGVEFEFIVVNDGSMDVTAAVLAEYAAADPRLVVIEQTNAGLTRALIRGGAGGIYRPPGCGRGFVSAGPVRHASRLPAGL